MQFMSLIGNQRRYSSRLSIPWLLEHPVDELFGFYVPGMEVDVKKNEYLFYRFALFGGNEA